MSDYIKTIKVLAEVDNNTLAKATEKVEATREQKAAAMKEINDYKYAEAEIAKWFRR